MTKYSEVVILCEDLQQAVFARTFLATCGIIPQRIRIIPLPAKGGGEGFVRKQYPVEVRAYRRISHHKRVGLVVMIDADNQSVEDHFAELARTLEENGLEERQPGERIGLYIPRRNIETWIYFLRGEVVDEVSVYRHLEHESDCKPYVQALAAHRDKPLPNNAPPSLQRACEELNRILP